MYCLKFHFRSLILEVKFRQCVSSLTELGSVEERSIFVGDENQESSLLVYLECTLLGLLGVGLVKAGSSFPAAMNLTW